MGKRFAIVIGVAAAGVMALGAQTALAGGPTPDLQLSGKKTQELGNAVKVKASCGDEACNVIARGKLTNVKVGKSLDDGGKGVVLAGLKPASADLGPGETTTLELKLGKTTRKKAGKVLDKGKKVQAKVVAAPAVGIGWTAKRTIKLVK